MLSNRRDPLTTCSPACYNPQTIKEGSNTAYLVKEENKYLYEISPDRIHLLEDRILCRTIKKSDRAGRFIIAGRWEYQVKTNIGRVLRLGQGYDGPLQEGDYVIFASWTGRSLQSPDETLVLLRPDNVLAVIERDA